MTVRLAVLLMAVFTLSPATPSMGVDRMHPVEMTRQGWTHQATHPAMLTDLLSINAPIRYRMRVDPGAECTLVAGFVERYWQEPGKRVMDLHVEGAEVVTVDAVQHAGYRMPVPVAVPCRDADGDGWLSVEIRMHPGVTEPNPLLNALWLFDRADWTSQGLTAEDVLTAAHDGLALYFIDAGTIDSDVITHDCTIRLAEAPQLWQTLKDQLTAYPPLRAEWGEALDALSEPVRRIGSSAIAEGSALYRQLNRVRMGLRESLIEAHALTYDAPTETRLFSPWGAMVRLRHEECLRITIENSRRPADQDYRWHNPWQRLPFPGWVQITPQIPSSLLSQRLGFGIHMGLKQQRYDPLRTVYDYGDGRVVVQVLNASAIGIYGEGVRLAVQFNRHHVVREGPLWYVPVMPPPGSIQDTQPLYMGVITESRTADDTPLITGNAAIVWADSLPQLRRVAARVSRWREARREADRTAARFDAALTVHGAEPYPSMVQLNRRAVASMQFLAGPLWAALDGGYTNIWVRDATSAVVHAALAGDPSFLSRWVSYLMNNPTRETLDGRTHTVFWAFLTLHMEKQQDGQFYAVRAAHAWWKLLGDRSRLKEWYPILQSAMEYQRSLYYNQEMGLYWEININEAALKEAEEWAAGERYEALMIDGVWPLRAYDLYINSLMYATYLMMAEMAQELGHTEASADHVQMARDLAQAMDRHLWDGAHNRYHCGLALLEDGRLIPFDWDYWDSHFDYIWAGTLYPMSPDPEKMWRSMQAMMTLRSGRYPGGMYFAPGFGHLAYLCAAVGQPELAARYLHVITEPSRHSGWNDEMQARYVINDAILENLNTPYMHKPQVFSIGPWMHGVSAQCAYMDCNGVTVVPGGIIHRVTGLRFRKSVLDIETHGVTDPAGLVVDGRPLPGTLRLPLSWMKPGRRTVLLLPGPAAGAVLAHTDFELRTIDVRDGMTVCALYGFGAGVLRFTSDISQLDVTDAAGNPMPHRIWRDAGGVRVQVDASGAFRVRYKQ